MDKLGIDRTIASITSPGTNLILGDRELAIQATKDSKNVGVMLNNGETEGLAPGPL